MTGRDWRGRLPVPPPLVHRRDVVRSNGQLVEVEHLVIDKCDWRLRAESMDPNWVAIPVGRRMIAYRVRA